MKNRRSVSLAATLVLLPGLLVASAGPAAAAVPTFSKLFGPNTIGPGSSSTLTFTIAADVSTTDITFTDTLPTGVTIADPANASMTGCGSGANGRPSNASLSAPDHGSTITFSGGAVAGGSACVITVDVTSSTVGIHTNVTGDLTSSEGNSGSATDDLTVDATLPGFSKSFAPATVGLGEESTLTLLIDNTDNASDVNNLDFTDNLPTGMVIADPPSASTDCGTAAIPPTLTANAGASTITLDANGAGGFPAVAAGATCTVTVDVTTSAIGELDNVSGNLLADSVDAGFASNTLEVTAPPVLHLDKDFTTDPAPPGAMTTLVLTVTNRDRNFPATDVAFTDDLTTALADLTFTSLTSNDCGGTVTGAGTTTIGLTGGTVASGITCTIVAELTVPAGATPGRYTNTTTAVTGTIDGAGVTGNVATAGLFVEPIPILTVEFTDDPVGAGGDVTLRHTLTNTSSTSALTDGEFVHQIVPPLPHPATVTLPPTPDPPCGAGSSLALVSTGPDQQGLELTGGSLAAAGTAGDSCTFDVTITVPEGFPAGAHTFTTGAPIATVDGATRTGDPASDDLVVVGAPRLVKEFTDDPVEPGQTVTLEFTLSNPGESASDLSAIGFTDDLDAALSGLAATGAMPTDPCGAGSSLTGTSVLTFSGGILAGGASCTFSVTLQVPAGAAPGTYTNTTSEVTATGGGVTTTGPAAEDDLIVAAFRVTKEFLDDPTVPGGTAALRFTLNNTTGATDATSIFFSDDFDAMLSGATATATDTSPCGGTLIGSGSGTLFLVGGTVTAGASCTFDVGVDVPASATRNTYTNTTSEVSYDDGSGTRTAPPATDDLVVVDGVLLGKEFTDDPVAPGDTATLEFTLTNEGAGAASAIAFTDDLDAALTGLTASSVLFNDCGATVDIVTDNTVIDVSGGTLADLATCTIRVAVAVPAAAPSGSHTNTTSTVTATIGGVSITGGAASDDLEVSSVLFTKAFDATTPAGTTAELTFTIQNRDTSTGLSRMGFTDDLNAALTGLVAVAPLPAAPCGARSELTGTSLLTFTDGELGTSDTCTFTVTVQVPADAPAGTHTNTTSDLSAGGTTAAPPATADLEVTNEADLRVTATPASTAVLVGGSTSTTFTVTNDGPSTATDAELVIDLTGSPTLGATPAGCTLAGTTLTCDLGDLAPTADADVVVGLTHATAGSDGLSGSTSSSAADTNLANNSTSTSIEVEPAPTVSITDNPDPVSAGQAVTFTVTIDNAASTLGATDLALSVDLGAALTGLAATNLPLADACGSGSTLSGTSTVTLADGAVAASGSCSFDIEALVPSDAPAGAFTTSTSRLTGDVDGTALDTDGDNESTTVARVADAFPTISPVNPSVAPGGTTSSVVTVANAGPSTASIDVDLTLDAPSAITAVTGAACRVALGGGSATCSLPDVAPGTDVDLTVEADHPTAGNDDLTVTTTTTDATDPDATNNGATSTIRVAFPPPPPPPAPSADLSASVNPASQAVEAGGTATTTVTVANAGPSNSADTTLTVVLSGTGAFGPAPAGCAVVGGELTCDLGALASGASAGVDVATTHAESGDTTLTATADSAAADPDDANDQATATITASAPPSEDLADDCKARPATRPSDANDGPHSGAIDCLVALDVISGFEDGSFRGTLDVSRAQFASMLVRAIDHLGLGLATNAPDAFDDDNGSPHEAAANRLAAAGILEGTRDRTFSGGLSISRSQVAGVLVRTVEKLTNVTVPPREDQFGDDDGKAFEAEHDAAAQLELVSGVAARQYRGVLPISRAQTASILARFIVLVDGPVS